MIVCFVRVYVFTKMVKEKPNSIRIYDDEGFRRRAACICVRSDAETEVSVTTMLFTSLNKFTNTSDRCKRGFWGRCCW